MLKKRLAATLLIRDGIVVQSIGFRKYLPVGCPEIAVDFLNRWGVDEVILLDISATASSKGPDMHLVQEVAKSCFVPLTVGGGITCLSQVRELIRCGADKVAFNQAALSTPELLTQVASVFGNQCVVASIDAIKKPSGYRVYDYRYKRATNYTPIEFAMRLINAGAGEIFINSVDCDGSRNGFDLSLIGGISTAVHVPVICCGGAGVPRHFIEVFQHTNVQAASASNFLHFTEHSITTIKAELCKANIKIRHDTHIKYLENQLDENGRLRKKPDHALEDLLFVHLEKEKI